MISSTKRLCDPERISQQKKGAFTNLNGPEHTGMDLHNRNGSQNSP